MARIIHNFEEIELPDGQSLISATMKLGVTFGCRMGKCGSCKIKVISGGENLSSRESCEDMLGLDEDERLACRCYIKEGEMEFEY